MVVELWQLLQVVSEMIFPTSLLKSAKHPEQLITYQEQQKTLTTMQEKVPLT